MAALHELLAVVGDLSATAKKINDEAVGTFGKKPELFLASVTSVDHFNDADKNLNSTEHKEMTTTVGEKLRYIVRANVRALDAYLQKEATNQKATADIVIGEDVKIASNVPATVLLGLESKLSELRNVYAAIPTLSAGVEYALDPALKPGAYRAVHPEVRFRTRKTLRAFQMAPPTEHHPAQVQVLNDDVPVASITVQTWSGMITSAQKSDLLERVDRLIRAVKRARMRANMEKVEQRKLGDALFNYIHDGIVA